MVAGAAAVAAAAAAGPLPPTGVSRPSPQAIVAGGIPAITLDVESSSPSSPPSGGDPSKADVNHVAHNAVVFPAGSGTDAVALGGSPVAIAAAAAATSPSSLGGTSPVSGGLQILPNGGIGVPTSSPGGHLPPPPSGIDGGSPGKQVRSLKKSRYYGGKLKT